MSKRHAHYCKRIVDRIIEEVALGASLRRACQEAGPLAPNVLTFWRWMNDMPELKLRYQEALAFQASTNADLILDLVGECLNTPSKAPAIKIACDLLKWHAEMRDPAQYAPKGNQVPPAPPKTLKQMQEEADKLQQEFGVEAQPGMVTAPKVLRDKQGGDGPSTPALKVVNGGKDAPAD